MQQFAVVGHPIAHSLSPSIHQAFAQQCGVALRYEKVDIAPENFAQWVHTFFDQGGAGLNVTIPFKEQAYHLAQQSDKAATKAQAANTLWMDNKRLHAANTDGIGLLRDLARHIELAGASVLILGAGGATRGIIAPLMTAECTSVHVSNRNPARAEQLRVDFPEIHLVDWSKLGGCYDLIIHATAAQYSHDVIPLQAKNFSKKPLIYDLSYSLDGETHFNQYCQDFGWSCVDGLGMLVEQAAVSFSLWLGRMPQTEPLLQALRS